MGMSRGRWQVLVGHTVPSQAGTLGESARAREREGHIASGWWSMIGGCEKCTGIIVLPVVAWGLGNREWRTLHWACIPSLRLRAPETPSFSFALNNMFYACYCGDATGYRLEAARQARTTGGKAEPGWAVLLCWLCVCLPLSRSPLSENTRANNVSCTAALPVRRVLVSALPLLDGLHRRCGGWGGYCSRNCFTDTDCTVIQTSHGQEDLNFDMLPSPLSCL